MKTRVVLLYGGQSAEHEVSCVSALHVAAAMNRSRYVVIPVGITKEGDWVLPEVSMQVIAGGALELPNEAFVAEGTRLDLFGGMRPQSSAPVAGAYGLRAPTLPCDVVFPVLHGPYGEDGTVQGFLEMAGVPYVGSGVLGSAVGMDKQMMKLAFAAAGLPNPRHVVFRRGGWAHREAALSTAALLGYPAFTKPANLGSSVGISRCTDEESLAAGIELAFKYDSKVIVEEGITGREIECALLGNEDPKASVCGEIIPGRKFYDYEAKYVEPSSKTLVPADLPERVSETIRSYAVSAFRAVGAAGLSRVDFFYDEANDRVLINEINTMPGFTEISMFPKLWAASGVGYSELIDRLIELALERAAQKMVG